jgi:hypothetical protein
LKVKGSKFRTILECRVLEQRKELTPDDHRLPMRVQIINPRPDAWRGEGTSPSFLFLVHPLPRVCSLQDTPSIFALPTARKEHAKRNPGSIADPNGYDEGSGRE